MALSMQSLAKVRTEMAFELASDFAKSKLYTSSVIEPDRLMLWKQMLVQAIRHHDDVWLGEQILAGDILKKAITRNLNDTTYNRFEMISAHEALAEIEFNRFYIRGVCLLAIKLGAKEVEVYRGKHLENPSSGVHTLLGAKLPAHELLFEIRRHSGQVSRLLPLGSNFGLTVRLVEDGPKEKIRQSVSPPTRRLG